MNTRMSPTAVASFCAAFWISSLAFSVEPIASTTTEPVANNGWSASLFTYHRPDELIVEESTPTAAQVDFKSRPPQMPMDAAEPEETTEPAKPRAMGPMNVIHLTFKDADGHIVPALLCTPRDMKGPFPLVIAVHGLRSHKAQVCAQVGPSLIKKGFAVLAPDMPYHGERRGDSDGIFDKPNPIKAYLNYRAAVLAVRQCIDLAEKRSDLTLQPGVMLVGYSMGSWIDSVAGPSDDRVKAMVLMVGGAMDVPQTLMKIPQIRAIDPRLALAHFIGPLLLLNGKDDKIVSRDMAERLFEAAPDPKEQLWFDSGHLLPEKAYEQGADWIAQTWEAMVEHQRDIAAKAATQPVSK